MLRFFSCLAICASMVATTPGFAGTIFAPGGTDNPSRGAPFNRITPFGPTSGGAFGPQTATGARRFQQIYDASLFSSLTGPQSITEIQFRASDPISGGRRNSITAFNTSISLSTTNVLSTPGATFAPGATVPTNFSGSFADNVGANVQEIYSGGLTLNRGGSNPSGSPQPFSYGFTLQTPFIYDPSMGNLLLDIMIPAGATASAVTVMGGPGIGAVQSFDAINVDGDGIASVYGTGGNAIGAANGIGLATQFTLSPVVSSVPEPGSCALWVIGVGCCGLVRSRRQRIASVTL